MVAKHPDDVMFANTMHQIERGLPVEIFPETDLHVLRERRTPGTCQNLLRSMQFIAWKHDTASSKILWLTAGPGSGKSVKASYLIDHYAGVTDTFCQYYFFKEDDAVQRSVISLYRSLSQQISAVMPTYRNAVARTIDEGTLKSKNDGRHLWHILFEKALFSTVFAKPLTWVIDALDECDSVSCIMSSLTKIPSNIPVHIILISRPLPSISAALARTSDRCTSSVDISNNHDDIQVFVEQEVAHLPGTSDFRASVVKQLVRRAEGIFLWVRLVLQELSVMHSEDDLNNTLDEMPNGMEAMYKRMEASISQLSKMADKEMAKTVLSWATYGKRPLHIDELSRVLQPRFPSLLNLRNSINQVCGHFVTVDASDRVALIHLTARDYLRSSSKLPFPFENHSVHKDLFEACMDTLLDPRLRSKLIQKKLPVFCEYASTAWPYHLARSSVEHEDTLSLIARFLNGPAVLPWIEILAIGRQLSVIVSAGTTLSAFAQRRRKYNADRVPLLHRVGEVGAIEQWATDMVKLVGKFGHHLVQDTSAIYKYIPPLSPLHTPLYQQFGKSSLSQISVSGLSMTDWDDLSSRLSVGQSHQASLLSCSGRYLAVATSANTIVIWDAYSFEEIAMLEHKEYIFRICFNTAGTMLASYGFSITVIWEVPRGFKVLEAPNLSDQKPVAVQFRNQDHELIMCSDTKAFRVLSTENPGQGWQLVHSEALREAEHIKNTFRNSPTSVGFNSDASQIAVAYRGAPLEVWDLESCELISTCKRSASSNTGNQQAWTGVNHVLWHPMQYEVLGLYTDGTVFKWQPLMEAHTELSDALANSPSGIQISPDGNVFLTSNVNGTIKMYTYHDFVPIYQLSSEDVITAMCFSPDCRKFFDIRGSYCNVWEPNALIRHTEANETSNGTESEVRSLSTVSMMISETQLDHTTLTCCLTVNAEGSLACLGDDEGTVTLFDIKNDSRMEVGSSPIEMGIERIVWSDDGRSVAYEDLARKLRVVKISKDPTIPSGFAYRVERILEAKIDLQGGITKQLIMNMEGTRLLALGTRDAQLWDLKARVLTSSIDVSPGIERCLNRTSGQSHLLALAGDVITAFDWGSEGLREVNRWRFGPGQQGAGGQPPLDRLITTPKGELIILVRKQAQLRGTESLMIQFIRNSSLDSPSNEVASVALPSNITRFIERPLTVLGSDLFVFIDKALWICTWRIALENRRSLDSVRGRRNPNSLEADTLESLGVTRHFFLPRDWVDVNTLALCSVLSDGTFVCPRKGEVAVIRSGLGSEW